jgi:signal transduction histidine kinase
VDVAAERARQVCLETYGVAPAIKVSGDVHTTLPYIWAHLDYILYEVLKNSLRAVVDQHMAGTAAGQGLQDVLPPVCVRLCAGPGNLTIQISDRGGGLSADVKDSVWQYGFTTNDREQESRGAHRASCL